MKIADFSGGLVQNQNGLKYTKIHDMERSLK
jgi:hypothetical protein